MAYDKVIASTMTLILALISFISPAPLRATDERHRSSSAAPAQQTSGGWTQLANNGPTVRFGHAMAYDIARDKVVLFGGLDAAGQSAETWEWDGSVWVNKSPTITSMSPGNRYGHAMAYDSIRRKVLLFGGITGNSLNGDTWEWDGAAWQQIATTGPSPRFRHTMASESFLHSSILLFGGSGSNGEQADTWEWDGVTWQLRSISGPSARSFPAMAYDSPRHRVVLFGGLDGNDNEKSDTWLWNGSKWTLAAQSGPPGRSRHSMVYDGRCQAVELFGGQRREGRLNDLWAWNGTSWRRRLDEGPSARIEHAMAYDVVRGSLLLFGGFDNSPVNDTWEWRCSCDDEAAPLDQKGKVIFPPDVDVTEPITYEDVEKRTGNVSDIYSQYDTTTDTWYRNYPCDPSIGGAVPQAASTPDLTKELSALGITGVTPKEIADTLNTYQDMISARALLEANKLSTAGPVTTSTYTPPAEPHCAARGCKYVFGGRDLIFVHGLQLDPLFDKIFGTDPGASTTWPNDRAAFYGSGYWKRAAENYWADHINRFLKERGIMNRYLIVAYPVTQRLEVGAQAILAQIADAMIDRIGVVDPSGHNDTSRFGTPSFMFISHSTGSLVADVAMAAAAKHPNLKAQFIPQFCKGHIAMNAVFSGSALATAAIVLSGYIILKDPIPPWLCPLANLFILALNQLGSKNPTLKCPPNYLAVAKSILVDLVPLVAQLKWGKYVKTTPVRTMTVIGGHPSYLAPFKYILQMGYDDGVATINSQVANPNTVLKWPSGFFPSEPFGLARIFDMGVWRTAPSRAIGYYIDQAGDHQFNLLGSSKSLVAAGATPYVSPTGMLQPVGGEYSLTGLDPLNRMPRHYSFIQSAADHYGGSIGLGHSQYVNGFNFFYYRDTFGKHNLEESRVITDPSVYTPYAMFYPNDDQPLLTVNRTPGLEEWVRGQRIHFKRRILGIKVSVDWWVWKRRYHLLSNWETKTAMDYVYESVLPDVVYSCPPPDPEHDCNHNGFGDDCDISSGVSGDCNSNAIPDECEGLSAPKITQGPLPLVINAGQPATFSVTATSSDLLSYQWFKNGTTVKNGWRVSGATTDTLTINPALSSDAGIYSVIVTGSCPTVSLPAPLIFVPCVNRTRNMVAWYPFDERAGSMATDLIYHNNGIHINSPTPIPGMVAGALSFDGINDYVEAPSTTANNIDSAGHPPCDYSSPCQGDFSIDAWIRLQPGAPSSTMAILDKRSSTDGYSFFLNSKRLGLQLGDSFGYANYTSVALPTLTDGYWHHIAVTVSRISETGIRWYYDGVPVSAQSNDPTNHPGSLSNNSPLRIGARAVGNSLSNFFQGDIDELEIIKRPLRASEVQAVYQAGPAGKCKEWP